MCFFFVCETGEFHGFSCALEALRPIKASGLSALCTEGQQLDRRSFAAASVDVNAIVFTCNHVVNHMKGGVCKRSEIL